MKGLIDSHFHLLHLKTKNVDITEVLEQLMIEGFSGGIDIGTALDDLGERTILLQPYPSIKLATGLGPWAVEQDIDVSTIVEEFISYVEDQHFDFIGEIGLDNYWNYGTKERQKELFVAQIKYATRCKKPIIIHSRDADTEMIQTLNEVDLPYGGIMHCYSSGWELLETAIEKGLYISFAGPITFKNAKELHKMVSYVPLHLLLLETDSPYLAPHPHRGKINTPLNMRYIYEQAALLREMEVEDLIKVIQQNFESLCKGH
ncbi:MAG: TatD family hydrolase [Sphaerochaetaceae bacterium]